MNERVGGGKAPIRRSFVWWKGDTHQHRYVMKREKNEIHNKFNYN